MQICLEVMHQLRPAHLLEALQEIVVADVGKEETELFVEVLGVADQSRKVKQGDGDIVLCNNEKQVVEHSGEGGLLFFRRLCVHKASGHLLIRSGARIPVNHPAAFGG